MKNKLCAAAVLASGLFGARASHAQGWVQVANGAGTQIAVGANDIPYVLGTDGNVYYLAKSTQVCTSQNGGNLCLQETRSNWISMGLSAQRIAADQYNYLWRVDSAGGVSMGVPSTRAFDPSEEALNVGACITSLAPGRMLPYTEWNYPFGVASGTHTFPLNQVGDMHYTTTYATGCTPTLSSLDVTLHEEIIEIAEGAAFQDIWVTTNGWQPIDTGELQVAQFTIDGSADQVPWFFHTAASGNNVAYAYNAGTYTYASAPEVFGGFASINYMTDHYVSARLGVSSAVWQWVGDAYGRGSWNLLAGSNVLPNGGSIVQIAYSAALPGTRLGAYSGLTRALVPA